MTRPVPLARHWDSTKSHGVTEIRGPEHLASLMPGTLLLISGWEYMKLTRDEGWVNIAGHTISNAQMWQRILNAHQEGRRISLLHIGAA